MFRMDPIQYNLPQSRIPQAWYNILPDLPKPLAPVLHPGTLKPIGPDDLAPLFPMSLILQEVSAEREIEIPEEVRQVYAQWRPVAAVSRAPLGKGSGYAGADLLQIRRRQPGRLAQAEHRRRAGLLQQEGRHQAPVDGDRRGPVGLGAGDGLRVLRPGMQGLHGARELQPEALPPRPDGGLRRIGHRQPEQRDGVGPRDSGASIRDSNGSLGIAISEAVEVAAKDPHTKYALGSVLNHVLLHQTVIGQEAIEQMALAGDEPDVIIGCTGGGSNFAGLVMPYLAARSKARASARVVAVEPAACPSLTKGRFTYDFGDTGHLTPLVKMHTLGSTFMPPGIHAGGLRYHGMAPLVSHVMDLGLVEATAVQQLDAFAAGIQFARAEGIIPAPEANHAIAGAIREALRAKARGKAADHPLQSLRPRAFRHAILHRLPGGKVAELRVSGGREDRDGAGGPDLRLSS